MALALRASAARQGNQSPLFSEYTSADPSTGAGLQRPIGWRALFPNGTGAWDKTGAGATAWTVVGAGAGGFPGFSVGAPPKVASASAAGLGGTAARGDHTHGLDLVAYAPSLAGMQASGVVQQTYAAPNATPSALAVTTGLVPFGAPANAGTLTTSANFFLSASGGLVVQQAGSSATPATGPANVQFAAINDGGSSTIRLYGLGNVASNVPQLSWRRARGTFVAPAAVVAGDNLASFITAAYDGATYVISSGIMNRVPADGNVSAGNVTQMIGFMADGPSPGTQISNTIANDFALGIDTDSNSYIGKGNTFTTTSTAGFVYMCATQGAPTGVPTRVWGDTNRALNRTPMQFDITNGKLWAYYGGAWHFAAFT